MKKRSKSYNCQTGGDVSLMMNPFDITIPWDSLPPKYVPSDIDADRRRIQAYRKKFGTKDFIPSVPLAKINPTKGQSNKSTSNDRFREQQYGGDVVSTMGYQDNSPFNTAPSLNINSPNISMANVSQPLIGISNQTGETKLMKPNKNYKFKNTQSVTEVPAYQTGGELGQYLKEGKNYNKKISEYLKALRDNGHSEDVLKPLENYLYNPYRTTDSKTNFGVRFNGNIMSSVPGGLGSLKVPEPKRKPKLKVPDSLPQRSIAVEQLAPTIQSQYNLMEQGVQNSITKKAYDNLLRGELLQEYKTGKKLSNSVVVPKYNGGGAIGMAIGDLARIGGGISNLKDSMSSGDFKDKNLLGKYADVMGALPGAGIISPLISQLANVFAKSSDKVISASPGNYQTGGDIPLSSDSFQVKGNANTVDGNKYQIGNKKIALDHNEVIMDTTDGNKFVFSDSLKDPKTNKSYAELAAKYSKAKGEAEKVLAMPKTHYDEQAKSTVSQSNAILDTLATQQEEQATMMGLRNEDGSTKQSFQDGGPVYMLADKEKNYYYDPYDDRLLQRDPVSGKYTTVANKVITNNSGYQAWVPLQADITQHLAQYPRTSGVPFAPSPDLLDLTTAPREGQSVVPTPPVVPTAPSTNRGKKKEAAPAPIKDPMLAALLKARTNIKPDPYAEQAAANAMVRMPPLSSPTPTNMDARAKIAGNTYAPQELQDTPEQIGLTENGPVATTPEASNYKTPWTIGDALKGVELLSKGIGAFGKPEVEKAVTDNSPLTQQTFDPTNALYQNRRAYSNYVNTLPVTSLGARRALGSNALSNLYSSNNSVVSQYQAMNQQARQTYEDRLSNRRRFNSQQITRANEVNAANRAAQDAVQQNFFTSIGQFGEDINRKRYAQDQVNLLRTQYPDVFENFLKTLQ